MWYFLGLPICFLLLIQNFNISHFSELWHLTTCRSSHSRIYNDFLSAILWFSCLSLVGSFNSWEVHFFWSATLKIWTKTLFLFKFNLLSKWIQFQECHSMFSYIYCHCISQSKETNQKQPQAENPNSWNPSSSSAILNSPCTSLLLPLVKTLEFSLCIWYVGLLSKDFVFNSEEFGWKTNWEECTKGKGLTAYLIWETT